MSTIAIKYFNDVKWIEFSSINELLNINDKLNVRKIKMIHLRSKNHSF